MSYLRAISTQGCPDFSLEAVFALAARHRVDALELRVLAGSLDLPAYFAQQFGTPERFGAAVRAQAARVLVLDTSWKLMGAAADERQKFLAFVPWAEAAGVPWLRVFDGGDATAPALAEAAASVEWWRAERARHGWRCDLAIETHDSLLRAETLRAFDAVAPGTAIIWDSHHTWKKGGEDPLVTWAEVKTRAPLVHVKDSIAQPSARHPYTYVLPGDGEFPMAPLRAVLEREFSGHVCLEWEKIWHPYLPPLDDALRVAAERCWW